MKLKLIIFSSIIAHTCVAQIENFSLGVNYQHGFTKSINDTLKEDKHSFITNFFFSLKKNLIRDFHFETGFGFDTYGVSAIADLYNPLGHNVGKARAREVFHFLSVPVNFGFIFNRFQIFTGTRLSLFVRRKFTVGGLVVAKDKKYMNGDFKLALNIKAGYTLIKKRQSKFVLAAFYNWLPTENFYSFGLALNITRVLSFKNAD